jgi:hypothetical protein
MRQTVDGLADAHGAGMAADVEVSVDSLAMSTPGAELR